MAFAREKVIISVDDFGMRRVADSILPLAEAGKIDRVSVLIRYITSQEQIEAIKATSVKIDLHLEIIDLIKSGEDTDGSAFFRGINFFTRYIFGMVSASSVEHAWIQQIELFKEKFGRYPDGLNSHEHVHYFPRYLKVMLALGKRYHIPFARFASQGISEARSSMVSRIVSWLWRRDKSLYDVDSTSQGTSDFFVSYDWIADFDTFLEHLPSGTTEIAFHPERPKEYAVIEKYF